MSVEDNKIVVRRFLEETPIQGNFEIFDTSFDPHLVLHISNTPLHTHASYRELLRQFQQAYSDRSVTVHDLIAEGDTVAARTSYTSPKHHGQFGKNSPTDQPLQVEVTFFFHFEQGKVTEIWVSHDRQRADLSGFGE